MEYVFAPILWFTVLTTMGCPIYLLWKKSAFSKKHAFILNILLSLMLLFYTVGATLAEHNLAKWMFCLFGITSLLTAGELFMYSRDFTKTESKIPDGMKYFGFIAIIDIVLIIANPFFNILYTVTDPDITMIKNGITNIKFPYYFHAIIVLCLIMHSAILLFKKFRNVPFIYGIKYIIMSIVIPLIYVAQSICIFSESNPYYPIPFIAVISFLVVFFSSKSLSWEFGECQRIYSNKKLDDGHITVNFEGEIVHFNDSARKYIDDITEDGDIIQDFVSNWFNENGGMETEDLSWETEKYIDGNMRNLCYIYTRLFDKKNQFIGGSFIIHDRTGDVKRIEKEMYNATHDALTGLFNKEFFCKTAYELIKTNPAVQFYIICCDVKSFKLINEIFGVEKGDEILKHIGKSIGELDLKNSVYGRFGGDSFAICMPKEFYNDEQFINKAEEISSLLNSEYHKIHIHFGVYEVDSNDASIQIMCDRAFLAIKEIKASYSSVIAVYSDVMRKEYMRKQKINVEFEKALNDGCFVPYIQPQCFVDRTSRGGEVLVRWRNPDGSISSPKDFIDIYEESGLIGRLDMYIWECACKQLVKWRRNKKNYYLSINISPKDFYLMDVYEVITGLVKKYRLSPKSLNLEITETAIMDNPELLTKIIDKFRNYGFAVEMDDFGSGNSSLNMLKDVNIDIIKADMCFLQKTKNSERSEIILNHVIALALDLNHGLIVEGVETQEQLIMLSEKGCKAFQGYYFDKPITFEEYEAKYPYPNAA